MDFKERAIFYKIQEICHLIAHGDYSHVHELKRISQEEDIPKLLRAFASNLSSMILKLQRHEHELEKTIKELEKARFLLKEKNISLKEKIHTLEINIDVIKRNKEVDEILESDFFKEIKHKSSQRKQRKKA